MTSFGSIFQGFHNDTQLILPFFLKFEYSVLRIIACKMFKTFHYFFYYENRHLHFLKGNKAMKYP